MGDKKEPKVSRREFIHTTSGVVAATGVAAATGAATGACKGDRNRADNTDAPARRQRASGNQSLPGASRKPAAAPASFPPPEPRIKGRARVVVVRDAEVLDKGGHVRARVLSGMLDQAVTSLLLAKTADDAWKRLLKPSDVLGIKTNAWKYLRTPPALETAIARQARKVGITADRILVDDRGARKTLPSCTALINARPLRSHHWSGIGGCLKNYIMFVPTPWSYHPDSCADLGALMNLPAVKGKTRLHILVMLTPLFHGRGPHHFSSQYLWPYRGLVVSTDPVAVDRVGLEILRAKRLAHFGEARPFTTRTHHVELADTRHGVGIADLKRIDIEKIGWRKDLLLPG